MPHGCPKAEFKMKFCIRDSVLQIILANPLLITEQSFFSFQKLQEQLLLQITNFDYFY